MATNILTASIILLCRIIFDDYRLAVKPARMRNGFRRNRTTIQQIDRIRNLSFYTGCHNAVCYLILRKSIDENARKDCHC